MQENQLLDVKDDRTYFVYLTNRGTPFQMFERHVDDILNRMREEIPMGYTNLWVMKRIGIIHSETLSYFADNELLIEDKNKVDKSQKLPYKTFLFAKITATSAPMYMPHLQIGHHATFEDAADFSADQIKQMKEHYPNREFTVLCAKRLHDLMWH
ncbi:hypothetical protein [Planococcus sp. YIM B11945]|uniref:hypothetical protein n=1 Tax=Planococcus sp. YIM B11945 TaxID=3435410 RepID=UPI003D7F1844